MCQIQPGSERTSTPSTDADCPWMVWKLFTCACTQVSGLTTCSLLRSAGLSLTLSSSLNQSVLWISPFSKTARRFLRSFQTSSDQENRWCSHIANMHLPKRRNLLSKARHHSIKEAAGRPKLSQERNLSRNNSRSLKLRARYRQFPATDLLYGNQMP